MRAARPRILRGRCRKRGELVEDRDYFEEVKGRGVLATADGEGRVDAAVYARPHVTAEGHLAFVMTNRLSHANLQSNPHAAFLFMEAGTGWKGKRFFLTKVRESSDPDVIDSLRRRKYAPEEEERMKPLAAVYFTVDRELPLIGSGEE
jgi:hypothetical protein